MFREEGNENDKEEDERTLQFTDDSEKRNKDKDGELDVEMIPLSVSAKKPLMVSRSKTTGVESGLRVRFPEELAGASPRAAFSPSRASYAPFAGMKRFSTLIKPKAEEKGSEEEAEEEEILREVFTNPGMKNRRATSSRFSSRFSSPFSSKDETEVELVVAPPITSQEEHEEKLEKVRAAVERHEEEELEKKRRRRQTVFGSILLPAARVTISSTKRRKRKDRNMDENTLVDVEALNLRKGMVTAVMGPSGAGKTTWMNNVVDQLLSSNSQHKSKKKGRDSNGDKLRIGYVTQEAVDSFPSTSTPREVLQFHRDTRFREVTDEYIQRILRSVHLEGIQDTPLKDGERNNLSGGERKKLAVALELLASPSLLILDEPLSGLDSRSATLMMRMLVTLTEETGSTILMTVHQPEINVWRQFDDLIVFKAGKLWDSGQVEDIIEKHQVTWNPGETPAEGLLRVVMDGKDPGEVRLDIRQEKGHSWQKTEGDKKGERKGGQGRVMGWFDYFWVLKCVFFRDVRARLRMKTQLIMRLFRVVCFNLVAVAFFWQLKGNEKGIEDKFSFFFYCVFALGQNLVDPLYDFLTSLQVWDERERRDGHVSTSQFFLSQVLWESIFCGFINVNAIMCVYYAADMKTEPDVLATWWFTLFFMYLNFMGFMYCCSVFTRNSSLASLMFFPLNACYLQTGGFLRIPDNIPWPMKGFTYLSFYRYAIDGQAQLEYRPVKDNPGDLEPFKHFLDQHSILPSVACLFVVASMGFAVLFIAFLCLRYRVGYTPPLKNISVGSTDSSTSSFLNNSTASRSSGLSPEEQEKGVIDIAYCKVWVPGKKSRFSKKMKQPQKRLLLIDDGLQISPGKITGIMGPSGCGKSTLLNAISGQVASNLEGEANIFIGNEPLSHKDVGYVMQDVGPGLTKTDSPIEILQFHRDVSGRKHVSDQDIVALLDLVGLSKRAQHNPIGRNGNIVLSGGEKKKLAIAQALITTPKVLCLDEALTGLDSVSATEITKVLYQIARETNVTVIMTVHQPGTEVLQLLDSLVIIQKGGHLLAHGSREEVTKRCEIAINSGESQTLSEKILQWCEGKPMLGTHRMMGRTKTKAEDLITKGDLHVDRVGVRGNWIQVFKAVLTRETITRFTREKKLLASRILAPILMTILQCFLFFQLKVGAKEDEVHDRLSLVQYYFLLMTMVFTPIQNLYGERLVLFRAERKFQAVTPEIFYLSQAFFENLFAIINVVIFIPSYWICNLRGDGTVFGRWCFVFYLGYFTVMPFLYLLTCLIKTPSIRQGIVSVVTSCFWLIAGFNRPIPQLTWVIRWMTYLAWTRYMYEAWVREEFLDRGKKVRGVYNRLVKEEFDEFNWGECVAILIGIAVGLHLIAFLTLKFRVKERVTKILH